MTVRLQQAAKTVNREGADNRDAGRLGGRVYPRAEQTAGEAREDRPGGFRG